MVCMIADYKEDGIDKHNEYIALNTDNFERAVYVLSDTLRKQGAVVSCITVCPGAKNMEDLRRFSDDGIKPGNVYIPYLFNMEGW